MDPTPPESLAALMHRLPGWWTRRALRRLLERPDLERLAALVDRVRRTRQQPLLDALSAALAATHPELLALHCMGPLGVTEVALFVAHRHDIVLRLRPGPAAVAALLRSAGAVELFRSLPSPLRRRFCEVVPPAGGTTSHCPVCDSAELRHGKSTATGREVHEHYCYGCGWLHIEDCGPSLSELLYGRRPVKPPRIEPVLPSGEQLRVHLTVTDVMGYYDDATGLYHQDPDPLRRSTSSYWFRVPAEWLVDGTLPPAREAALHTHLYGEDWRYGRERSRYVVLASEARILGADEQAARPWLASRRVYVPADEGFREASPDDY